MITNLGSTGTMRDTGERHRLVASVASEAMGIGKSSEVLTVLGGKASCRRKFVLHVHLVDEEGSLVSRDIAIVASVAYAHDHTPVVRDEKPFLAEPPLFTTFNGVEFPAQDRPTRMVSGRASFKLAISLLSSKCDNRLFCICFTPQTPAGEVSSICRPCYSKPIRSISRKRTQTSSHASPAPQSLPPPSLEGTEVSQNSVFGFPVVVGLGSAGCLNVPRSTSPDCSSENDSKGAGSPEERQLQGSSRSSSGTSTSMLYLSPSSVRGVADGIRRKEGRGGCPSALVLQESPSPHSSGRGIGSLTSVAGTDGFGDTDPSGSSTGTVASIACSLSPANTTANFINKIPCSLSLRLSPSDSGSPTSAAPDSSFDNKDSTSLSRQSSPLAGSSSKHSVPAPGVFGKLRPFRPYASVGPCKLPLINFQLGNTLSLPSPRPSQSVMQNSPTSGSSGDGIPGSTHSLLERVHELRSVSPVHKAVTAGKEDFFFHNFSLGSCGSEEKLDLAQNELSLEQEEKSLQYIEVSLQEVSREVQRRKEELRSKRRRLLEDEARIHSITLQSSSWIESISSGLS